ncbi:MAG: preprotein translocase subunit SecG, partial [Acidithiobacillus sp.]
MGLWSVGHPWLLENLSKFVVPPDRRGEEANSMYTLLLVFQVIICVVLVGLILIQKGQGADIGAVFGGGGS